MRAGNVHDRPDNPEEGGLALFCPACPQIGINTAPETEWKAEDRYDHQFRFPLITFLYIFKTFISATNGGRWEYEISTSADETSGRRCFVIRWRIIYGNTWALSYTYCSGSGKTDGESPKKINSYIPTDLKQEISMS